VEDLNNAISSDDPGERLAFWNEALAVEQDARGRWRVVDLSLSCQKMSASWILGSPFGYPRREDALVIRAKLLIWLCNREWGSTVWKRKIGGIDGDELAEAGSG
jgi:hypothetical protein